MVSWKGDRSHRGAAKPDMRIRSQTNNRISHLEDILNGTRNQIAIC